MSLVVGEIRVGLDSLCHLFKVSTLLQFYIYHTTMNAFTYRNSHGKRILHTGFRTYTYGVSHGTTRSEVGIGKSFRRKTLHKSAHHGVRTRVPAGRYDGNRTVFLSHRHEGSTIVDD